MSTTFGALTLAFALIIGGVDAFWDSIVSVDHMTFDKIVTPEVTTIVKFDIKYPHGDPMMAWRKFAERVGTLGTARIDVLPAEVNCHHQLWHSDDTEWNMELCRRFNVSFNYARAEDFKPVIYLFRRGEANFAKPIKYTEKKIEKDLLLRWTQKHVADSWLELGGTSQAMDVFGRKFLRAGGGGDGREAVKARDQLLDQAMLELEALKAGRRRTVTRAMRRLGLNATTLGAHLTAEESEEAWDKESTGFREKEKAREDIEYYVTVMCLVQEFGINAVGEEKRQLAIEYRLRKEDDDKSPVAPEEILKEMNKRKGALKTPEAKKARQLRQKLFVSPKREHIDRLETRLNILSTFRSAAAVTAVNIDELAVIKEEKLAAFAARRKKLTGSDRLSSATKRKLMAEKQEMDDARREQTAEEDEASLGDSAADPAKNEEIVVDEL